MEANQNTNSNSSVSPITQSAQLHLGGADASIIKKPKPKFPLILILGIILLFLVVGSAAGFYVYRQQSLKNSQKPISQPIVQKQIPSPTPNPMANGKTYENSAFGYEIQYPVNWFLQGPYGGQAGYECADVNSDVKIAEFSHAKLTTCGFIGEELPPEQGDITIWVNKEPWQNINILGKPDQNIIIAGENVAKYIFTAKSDLPNVQATRLYFNHNDKGYLIFLKQTDKKGSYIPIYDQILSTFKFTNSQTTDTSTWQIYTNEKFNYSFKYPSFYKLGTSNDSYVWVQYCPTGKPEDCGYPSDIFQITLRENRSRLLPINWLSTSTTTKIIGLDGCFLNDPRTIKNTNAFDNYQAISLRYTLDATSAKGVCKGKLLEGGGEEKDLFIFKDTDVYHLSITQATQNRYSELEKILSTFKFTK